MSRLALVLCLVPAAATPVSTSGCAASNWNCQGGLASSVAAWCSQLVGSTVYCPTTCATGPTSSMSDCANCVLNMYAMTSQCAYVGSTADSTSSAPPSSSTSVASTSSSAALPASSTSTGFLSTKPTTLAATTTASTTAKPSSTSLLSTTTVAATTARTTTTPIATTVATTQASTSNAATTIRTTAASPSTIKLPAPRRVVYIDYRDIAWSAPTSTVTAAVDAGYNVIILAFLLASGPADMAVAWQGVGAQSQVAAMSYAHSRGAIVMVSAGGATDEPWTSYLDGASYGAFAGQWAKANNLDGVDFDIENLGPGFTAGSFNGDAFSTWLAQASIAAKQFVQFVSHALQAPYFGPIGNAAFWPGSSGGYSAVEAKANGAVDFYNVQLYNQGATCYTTFAGIFTKSSSDCTNFPGTSVAEIASYGVPLSKLTVTKYLLTGDGGNGYVAGATLKTLLAQAEGSQGIGYTGGISCWAYAASSSAAWIAAVCGGGVC